MILMIYLFFLNFRRCLLFVILVSLIHLSSAFAQFGVHKVPSDPLYSKNNIEFELKPRFNRVEGIFPELEIRYWIPQSRILTHADAGYGFRNQGTRYRFGIQKSFFSLNRFVIGAEVFDETKTNDSWMISLVENSLAGIFLREDFYNYFERKGWTGFVEQALGNNYIIRISYFNFKYMDMATFSNFSGTLFGWRKHFRVNPHIPTGSEESVNLSMIIDLRDNEIFTTRGWYLEGLYQKTFGDFISDDDVDTDGLFITGKRYQPTWGNQRLIFRSMAGFRKGSLFPQYLMWIGGVGSLRAFRDRLAFGSNFLLFNLNYFLGGDLLQRIPMQFIPLYDTFSLGFFMDAGDAWNPDHNKSNLFDGFTDFNPFFDTGVSLLISEGLLHIDFAKQIRQGDGSWRITFRLLEKF